MPLPSPIKCALYAARVGVQTLQQGPRLRNNPRTDHVVTSGAELMHRVPVQASAVPFHRDDGRAA